MKPPSAPPSPLTEPREPGGGPSPATLEVLSGGAVVESRPLAPVRPLVIGRSEKADWRFEGESFLSRRHVEVRLSGKTLAVRKLPEASNPVIRDGEVRDEFVLADGESFVIGTTLFRFVLPRREISIRLSEDEPSRTHTMSAAELYAHETTSDKHRLHDLLELPEILRTRDRAGFYAHIAGMLRLATGAVWSCVLTEEARILGEDCVNDVTRFSVSRTLLSKAVAEAPQPTLYCWSLGSDQTQATVLEGINWSICAAVKIPGESAVAFYVAGSGESDARSRKLREESARFVGLVADIVGRSLALDREKRLEHYFSGPVVKKILKSANPADLEPRLARGTVMFFDIRGFSKKSEGKLEKMVEHFRDIKTVMTAMTGIILAEHGTVLSYIGDAIFACWNLPYEDPEHIDRAVRAAMAMSRELERITEGWQCGIGLHCGEVVAGTIGSDQIFSYGVMGPVVNQASRVEGITKQVGVRILVSREVAERISPSVAIAVRIGKFRPAGMDNPIDLYDLTEASGEVFRREIFDEGLAAFEAGNWDKAYQTLHALPAEDMAARFIMGRAAEYSKNPPKDWKGVIALREK